MLPRSLHAPAPGLVLPERPMLHVLASVGEARAIVELFQRRGFTAGVLASAEDVVTSARAHQLPDAVIVDLMRTDAHALIDELGAYSICPVLVGIVDAGALISASFTLDAAFIRPVDPMRLLVCIVKLLGERKKGRAHRRNRVTGIVAKVDGNALFREVERELQEIMSPVCAGAVLEMTLHKLDTTGYAVTPVDLEAILASGRLATALRDYAPLGSVCSAVARIRGAILHGGV